MSVEIDLQLQPAFERRVCNHISDVGFHIGARECVHNLSRKGPQIVGEPIAKIKPGQLVPPRSILKTLNGAAVNLLDVTGPLIGAEKIRKAVVQARIIGVAIEFAPVQCERVGNPVQLAQPGDVPLQHLSVVGRAGPAATERNLLRPGGKFGKQSIVHREFFRNLLAPRIRIRDLERYPCPLLCIGEIVDERGTLANDRLILTVQGVAFDDPRQQLRASSRTRKAIRQQGVKIRRFRPVEIGFALSFLGRELNIRILGIEDQREDSIEEARRTIDRRDIAVEGEVSAAEPDGLVRRFQQRRYDLDQRGLLRGRVPTGQAVERISVAHGFIVVIYRIEELGESVQLGRCP